MSGDDSLRSELYGLRKGAGATPSRVARSTALLAALGASNGEDGLEQLRQAVTRLGDDTKVDALCSAFGFDMERPGLLTERRASFARLNDKHADTVEAYENEMLELLIERLTSSTQLNYTSVGHYIRNGWLREFALMTYDTDGNHKVITLETFDSGEGVGAPLLIFRLEESWPLAVGKERNLAWDVRFRGMYPSELWLSWGTSLASVHTAQRTERLPVPPILDDGMLWLPTAIEAEYGTYYSLRWNWSSG